MKARLSGRLTLVPFGHSSIPGDKVYRGSRKHILDWVERPTFPVEMIELIGLPGIELPEESIWTPRSYRLPDEARLEQWGPRGFGPHPAWEALEAWWLVHR